jgi:hypothetical protein
MNIVRSIAAYDNISEELVTKFNIDEISLAELKSLFQPSEEDPLMYNEYEINSEQVEFFQNRIEIEFDFKTFSYFVECRQKK